MEFIEAALDWARTTTILGESILVLAVAPTVALAIFAALATARRVLRRVLTRRADQTGGDGWRLAADVCGRVSLAFLFVLSMALGVSILDLPDRIGRTVSVLLVLMVFFQIGRLATFFFVNATDDYVRRRTQEDAGVRMTAGLVKFVGKVVIWSIALLFVLDNLGVDVTALVAGLGVGGIAIAFAAQTVLADLFASFSIVFDRPFEVGDFIIVGDYMGNVERVGIKTSRLRSLSGEQIVISNGDLLQSRIRNYKRMVERRIVFQISVTYDTPYDKLRLVPDMLKEIVSAQEKARLDRAHFASYGDAWLTFEVVYYVLSPDYTLYMDTQQAMNFEIFRRFGELGIEFAFPTQTLYVKAGDTEQANELVRSAVREVRSAWPDAVADDGAARGNAG